MVLKKGLAIKKWDLCQPHVDLAIVPIRSTKQPPESVITVTIIQIILIILAFD